MYQDLFDEDDATYTGPPLVSDAVAEAQRALGVRLPVAYLDILRHRNGGTLIRTRVETTFRTTWAPDHFEVHGLMGIGGRWGIDPAAELGGSPYLVSEWGYPDIGVVICQLPSGGHDTVMLDYRSSEGSGEPSVAYVDEDREPRTVAASFEDFISKLLPPLSSG